MSWWGLPDRSRVNFLKKEAAFKRLNLFSHAAIGLSLCAASAVFLASIVVVYKRLKVSKSSSTSFAATAAAKTKCCEDCRQSDRAKMEAAMLVDGFKLQPTQAIQTNRKPVQGEHSDFYYCDVKRNAESATATATVDTAAAIDTATVILSTQQSAINELRTVSSIGGIASFGALKDKRQFGLAHLVDNIIAAELDISDKLVDENHLDDYLNHYPGRNIVVTHDEDQKSYIGLVLLPTNSIYSTLSQKLVNEPFFMETAAEDEHTKVLNFDYNPDVVREKRFSSFHEALNDVKRDIDFINLRLSDGSNVDDEINEKADQCKESSSSRPIMSSFEILTSIKQEVSDMGVKLRNPQDQDNYDYYILDDSMTEDLRKPRSSSDGTKIEDDNFDSLNNSNIDFAHNSQRQSIDDFDLEKMRRKQTSHESYINICGLQFTNSHHSAINNAVQYLDEEDDFYYSSSPRCSPDAMTTFCVDSDGSKSSPSAENRRNIKLGTSSFVGGRPHEKEYKPLNSFRLSSLPLPTDHAADSYSPLSPKTQRLLLQLAKEDNDSKEIEEDFHSSEPQVSPSTENDRILSLEDFFLNECQVEYDQPYLIAPEFEEYDNVKDLFKSSFSSSQRNLDTILEESSADMSLSSSSSSLSSSTSDLDIIMLNPIKAEDEDNDNNFNIEMKEMTFESHSISIAEEIVDCFRVKNNKNSQINVMQFIENCPERSLSYDIDDIDMIIYDSNVSDSIDSINEQENELPVFTPTIESDNKSNCHSLLEDENLAAISQNLPTVDANTHSSADEMTQLTWCHTLPSSNAERALLQIPPVKEKSSLPSNIDNTDFEENEVVDEFLCSIYAVPQLTKEKSCLSDRYSLPTVSTVDDSTNNESIITHNIGKDFHVDSDVDSAANRISHNFCNKVDLSLMFASSPSSLSSSLYSHGECEKPPPLKSANELSSGVESINNLSSSWSSLAISATSCKGNVDLKVAEAVDCSNKSTATTLVDNTEANSEIMANNYMTKLLETEIGTVEEDSLEDVCAMRLMKASNHNTPQDYSSIGEDIQLVSRTTESIKEEEEEEEVGEDEIEFVEFVETNHQIDCDRDWNDFTNNESLRTSPLNEIIEANRQNFDSYSEINSHPAAALVQNEADRRRRRYIEVRNQLDSLEQSQKLRRRIEMSNPCLKDSNDCQENEISRKQATEEDVTTIMPNFSKFKLLISPCDDDYISADQRKKTHDAENTPSTQHTKTLDTPHKVTLNTENAQSKPRKKTRNAENQHSTPRNKNIKNYTSILQTPIDSSSKRLNPESMSSSMNELDRLKRGREQYFADKNSLQARLAASKLSNLRKNVVLKDLETKTTNQMSPQAVPSLHDRTHRLPTLRDVLDDDEVRKQNLQSSKQRFKSTDLDSVMINDFEVNPPDDVELPMCYTSFWLNSHSNRFKSLSLFDLSTSTANDPDKVHTSADMEHSVNQFFARSTSQLNLCETDIDTGEIVQQPLVVETDLDAPLFSQGKARSLINLNYSAGSITSPRLQLFEFNDAPFNRAKSEMEIDNQRSTLSSNAELTFAEKLTLRANSQTELRISKSLTKLNVPQWLDRVPLGLHSHSASSTLERERQASPFLTSLNGVCEGKEDCTAKDERAAPQGVVIPMRVTQPRSPYNSLPRSTVKSNDSNGHFQLPSEQFRRQEPDQKLQPIVSRVQNFIPIDESVDKKHLPLQFASPTSAVEKKSALKNHEVKPIPLLKLEPKDFIAKSDIRICIEESINSQHSISNQHDASSASVSSSSDETSSGVSSSGSSTGSLTPESQKFEMLTSTKNKDDLFWSINDMKTSEEMTVNRSGSNPQRNTPLTRRVVSSAMITLRNEHSLTNTFNSSGIIDSQDVNMAKDQVKKSANSGLETSLNFTDGIQKNKSGVSESVSFSKENDWTSTKCADKENSFTSTDHQTKETNTSGRKHNKKVIDATVNKNKEVVSSKSFEPINSSTEKDQSSSKCGNKENVATSNNTTDKQTNEITLIKIVETTVASSKLNQKVIGATTLPVQSDQNNQCISDKSLEPVSFSKKNAQISSNLANKENIVTNTDKQTNEIIPVVARGRYKPTMNGPAVSIQSNEMLKNKANHLSKTPGVLGFAQGNDPDIKPGINSNRTARVYSNGNSYDTHVTSPSSSTIPDIVASFHQTSRQHSIKSLTEMERLISFQESKMSQMEKSVSSRKSQFIDYNMAVCEAIQHLSLKVEAEKCAIVSNHRQSPELLFDEICAQRQESKCVDNSLEISFETLSTLRNKKTSSIGGSERLADESAVITCELAECQQNISMEEVQKSCKSCHNCYSYYCSRRCRTKHWKVHNKSCSHNRIKNACKQVLFHLFSDRLLWSDLSQIAFSGYSCFGRGCVVLSFENASSALTFCTSPSLEALNKAPVYVSTQEMQSSQLFDSHLDDVLRTCEAYDPKVKFVVNVAIAVEEHVPQLFQPQPTGRMIKKCCTVDLISLNKNLANLAQERVDAVSSTTRHDRDLFLTKVQRRLRQHGVILRFHFPDVYDKLIRHVESGEELAPHTIYPIDGVTGQRFMCLIMPDAEPVIEWVSDHTSKAAVRTKHRPVHETNL